ncbi:MAG TPA: EAL domain-containing protein [Gaiellaceae bacterium]|nr:EAL domain-containing protein [Gaiellaceae bacterium]
MEPGFEGVAHAPDADEIVRRYRTLVEQLPLVVYLDALDAASSNLYTSPQIEPLLGYSVDEWVADATLFIRTLHPEDRDRVLTAHAHTHATHEPLSLEYRLIASDGRVVWVRDDGVVVLDDDGAPLYLQGYLLDVTAEREAQAQLRQMALYDPLTGLANRAFFHEQLQQAVALRKESGEQTALLFVDLNHFKEVNDRFGHDVGDAVLARLGRRIQQTVRAGDGAARLGGDEFAIVLAAVSEPAEASHAAERLLQAIVEPIDLGPEVVTVAASIGIALGDEPETLLKEADAAMYRAKSEHDAGYAFFDSVLDSTAVERSRRAAELRRAVDNGEFTLDFQPVVELESRSISGYEALLRWEHPQLGRIPPLDFIPLAEDTGLIVPLGRWVLLEACSRGAVLHDLLGRPVRMSVNVSARQLQHPEFLDHVEEALSSSGFPAECLTLELTETVLLSSGDRVEQQLQALKAMGIMLALDDFGTGYASLAYLRRLPVDIVKIDRSFTAAIDGTNDDLVLLKGIVDLGNALGLTLVAEGIETEYQRRVVGDLGCHGAQGFYFGRPAGVPVLSTE